MEIAELPGQSMVEKGISDLERGLESVEALVVSIGARRIRRAGIRIPAETYEHPEHRLYSLLAEADEHTAHSQYNALIRRLVSYERALERSR